MALGSYSVLDILLPPVIIAMQDCSQALNTCKCLSSLSCWSVFNMLLVLSITFYCHYNIWGCMCSTVHFSLGDWKDIPIVYIIIIIMSEISTLPIIIFCLGCVPDMFVTSHHILSLIAYALRENRYFVFIIIAQFFMSSNSRMRFGLLDRICSFVHYTISLSSLCKLIWRH